MVSISTMHYEAMVNMGTESIVALNNGFHMAFMGAEFACSVAKIVSLRYIKTKNKKRKPKG